MRTETKLVLLGTGTPNAEPGASGSASAVVVNDRAYLVDFGPGVVRQCSKAYRKGITALHPKNLKIAFCTHLHTDHTAGYPDLIFTPWVLERQEPLKVFGRFSAPDKVILISGDTCPLDVIKEKGKNISGILTNSTRGEKICAE